MTRAAPLGGGGRGPCSNGSSDATIVALVGLTLLGTSALTAFALSARRDRQTREPPAPPEDERPRDE